MVISGLHAEIAAHRIRFPRSLMPRMILLITEMNYVP